MQLTFKLYASLMQYLPAQADQHIIKIEVVDDVTPLQVLEQFSVPSSEVHLVLVNGVFIPPSQRNEPLYEGDVLAVWPAVAGG